MAATDNTQLTPPTSMGCAKNMNKPVTFMSYNSTGINSVKSLWIKETLQEQEVDFCSIQEHFKTIKTTQQWFRQQFREYHCYTTQAYRMPGVDSGRGRGGLAQLANRQLAVTRTRVETKSLRLQAQKLTFSNCKLLWVNGYLPCDPQKQDFDDTELVDVLREVEFIIQANPDCEVIWSADMNWHRQRNNHFTRTVESFLLKLNLKSVWDIKAVDYTHIHTDGVSTSIIDHFVVSPNLLPKIVECGPIHSGDNMSRHSPIFLSLNLGELQFRELTEQPPPRRLPDWDRATKEEISNYRSSLQYKLQNITIPGCMLHCTDTFCTEVSHSTASDNLVLDVLMAIVESSYTAVPLTGKVGGVKSNKEVMPGWSMQVEPFRRASNAAYRHWTAVGKPRQGPAHKAKLTAHAQYKYAVRRVKRASDLHNARGLFEAAMEGDCQLLREMKRVKTGRKEAEELTNTVDGVTGSENVANKFKEVFEALFNCVDDKPDLDSVEQRIQKLLLEEDNIKEVNKLTADVVKKATMTMKSHKMDVSQGFSSDAFLKAPDELFGLLACVFQDWLRHGSVTKTVLACALIPLLKGTKNPDNTDNYRAIASSSLVLKIFEKCILLTWGEAFTSDSLQFGFKRNCSTNTASWLANEVLQHYLRKGSKPIACVLDCSKAFDLAKFSLIFSRALDSGLPAVVTRVILFTYKEQVGWIRWGRKCNSETFNFGNSTRQGSVGAPAFWSVYINPLVEELREAGIGCHIAGLFVGVVIYCDDILLLAPNRDAAQKMLEICESFAARSNIRFSTNDDPSKSKSKAIYVIGKGASKSKSKKPNPLLLCGKELPWVNRADHLGIALTEQGDLLQDCKEKRAQFINKSAQVREMFEFAHAMEKVLAIEKYCTSLHGSELWDLTSPEAQMVFRAWRTGIKISWNVPRATHSFLVQEVLTTGVQSLEQRILRNSVGFFQSLLRSPCQEVAVLSRIAARDIRSTLGKNIQKIREITQLDPWSMKKAELHAALEQGLHIEVPKENSWQPRCLANMLAARSQAFFRADENEFVRLTSLIDSLVTN